MQNLPRPTGLPGSIPTRSAGKGDRDGKQKLEIDERESLSTPVEATLRRPPALDEPCCLHGGFSRLTMRFVSS